MAGPIDLPDINVWLAFSVADHYTTRGRASTGTRKRETISPSAG
jgi:hypothetical protein